MTPGRALGLAAALGAAGCGGGTPLLHPAHAVPSGTVRMGAGTSGNFALGDAAHAMDRGRVAAAEQATTPAAAQRDFNDGAVSQILVAPGLAPWVGARAGFGPGDAGLTYTGRSTRIDARGVVGDEHVAFSAGAGASWIVQRLGAHATTGTAIPGLDTADVSGWGLDVPLLVGWRSDARLIEVWAGVRGGYERATGDVGVHGIGPAPDPQTAHFAGHRLYGGGLVGLAVGVAPVWVAVEVDGAYQAVQGTLGAGPETKLGGFTLAPAGALLAEF